MDIAKLHNLAISETGFVFDPVGGNQFNTNKTGVLIINCLKKGFTIDKIVDKVVSEYDIDKESCEQDVLHLIELLRSYYLI